VQTLAFTVPFLISPAHSSGAEMYYAIDRGFGSRPTGARNSAISNLNFSVSPEIWILRHAE